MKKRYTSTPGDCLRHMVVRDKCRRTLGDEDAIDISLENIRVKALQTLKEWNSQSVELHFVLTVEKPDNGKAQRVLCSYCGQPAVSVCSRGIEVCAHCKEVSWVHEK